MAQSSSFGSPWRKRKREEGMHNRDECPEPENTPKLVALPPNVTANSETPPEPGSDGPEHIQYWAEKGEWPKSYFEQFSMDSFLARKNLAARSDATVEGESQYAEARFEVVLASLGCFMSDADGEINEESRKICDELLEGDVEVPEHCLFRDDYFEMTVRNLRVRNKARIVQDIGRLIVPSAQTLATFGLKDLNCLTESVDERWDNCIALTDPQPQPDYAVGFKETAFTKEQLSKMEPIVGGVYDKSYFMSTYYMYFPFMSSEVRCAGKLDVADRQNAHSMALGVRAIVVLFRLARREKEINRKVLAFSISHDDRSVRIYGHFPVIDGNKTTYHRREIDEFSFVAGNGKYKWKTYKFVRNVYEKWMPGHLRHITSAIEKLPAASNSNASLRPESHVSLSVASEPALAGPSNLSSPHEPRQQTPNTSLTEGGAFKKPRNPGKAKR